MIVGWQGSAINALGQGYELRVIASTVIGGANLMGGEGGAFGAFIGAALIEVIRNSLLMAGVDFELAGHVRRHVHHSRGPAGADPRKALGLSGFGRAMVNHREVWIMKKLLIGTASAAVLGALAGMAPAQARKNSRSRWCRRT